MCQSWLSRVLSDVCLLLITNTVCITLWPLAWIMWRYQKYSHHGNSFTMITRLGGKDWPGKRSAPRWWCFGGEWSMTCWPTITQNAMSLKGDDWTPWLRAAFPYSCWCRASNCGYPALWRCKSVLQDTLVPTPPEIPLVSSVELLLLETLVLAGLIISTEGFQLSLLMSQHLQKRTPNSTPSWCFLHFCIALST